MTRPRYQAKIFSAFSLWPFGVYRKTVTSVLLTLMNVCNSSKFVNQKKIRAEHRQFELSDISPIHLRPILKMTAEHFKRILFLVRPCSLGNWETCVLCFQSDIACGRNFCVICELQVACLQKRNRYSPKWTLFSSKKFSIFSS